MRLGTRLDPRAKERLRRVSSSGGNEFVSRLTEGPVRTESDKKRTGLFPKGDWTHQSAAAAAYAGVEQEAQSDDDL